MEETLTDCLVRVREDLNDLKKVRDYLDTNSQAEGCCSVTWRTIEAFNSILGVCSSQHTPQTDALDILLDSFYYLTRNNTDPSVWNNFGFELGAICVKVLSAIERSEIFEVLFCKLLTVINMICEHNTNVWKTTARQILNIFINKKFSLSYFETVLKLYVCILRNIDGSALHNFSSQNLHLLKTLSMLVQRVGDFEIQSDVMELVFLHLSSNTQSMSDFFAVSEKKLFESLQFADFDADCRTYLNALNTPRGGFERKVYSVCCHVLYLGGCFVEPPIGTNSLWVDANRETERLSIRCADCESEGNRVIYILFSDILHVQLANEKTEGNRCLTMQTKSLSGLQFDVKNEDVCLIVENGKTLFEFVNFLNEEIKRKRKLGRKVSKTRDSLLIDRSRTDRTEKVQDDAITSSEKRGVDCILPDILNLFERAKDPTTTNNDVEIKTSQGSRIASADIRTPPRSQKAVTASQELSPNSFVESLNKHIGRDSPEIPRTFEDSVETIEYLQRREPRGSHKLFRSPEKVFDVIKAEAPNNFNFIFDDEKENKPVVENGEARLEMYERKREKPKPADNSRFETVLRQRKTLEAKLGNTQSQDYFQHSGNVLRKKKPSLPKLKRSSRTKKQKPEVRESKVESEQEKKRSGCGVELTGSLKEEKKENQGEKEARGKADNLEKVEAECQEKQRKSGDRKYRPTRSEQQEKQPIGDSERTETGSESKRKLELRRQKKPQKQQEFQPETKPSLLDPNGYAYRRWCEPTTSERSNFWLKKLSAMQKTKTGPDNVFDFSEDSDSVSARSKRKKQRVVVHPKRKYATKEMKQTSLKQVKEILKKASPKGKQKEVRSPRPQVFPKSPESFPDGCCDAEPQPPDQGPKQDTDPASPHPNSAKESDGESDFSNGDEDPLSRIKKRERSDEETSLIKTHVKKKSKTALPSGKLLSVLRHRLLRKEEKDKHQTDEIIRAVNKGVNHLFNHVQRKEGETVLSYLNAVEGAAAAVESDVGDLAVRAKCFQRAMLYIRSACSVSDLWESLEGHLSVVRASLRDLTEKKDVSRTIDRVNERLVGLIKSEIDRSIDSELSSRQNRLLNCTSIFDAESKELP